MHRLIRLSALLVCLLILFSSCQHDTSNLSSDSLPDDINTDNFSETIHTVDSYESRIDQYIDSSSGDYRYSIMDADNLKDSLIGKYVSVDNFEYYFEIKENEAILHKNFAKYAIFEPNDETEMQVVHIERVNDVLRLLFVHKYSDEDYLNVVEFWYMEEENKFAWYTNNGIYYFEKTGDASVCSGND